MTRFGWTYEQVLDADFYGVADLMSAKEEKDRVHDAGDLDPVKQDGHMANGQVAWT